MSNDGNEASVPTANVTLPVSPAFTAKGADCVSTVFSVSGSMSVRRAVPLMSPSLVLMTRAVMVA